MNDLEFGQQATDAQKWYRLWDLLFRGHTRPLSPYVETELGEIPQLLARSRDDVMQAMPALLQGSNIQADYLTMQALVHHIHNIYCSQFTPQGQQQAPRYRRQYAEQGQAQPPVQAFGEVPNPVADAAMLNTVAPGMLTLNTINNDDLSQFINQQGVDDFDMIGNFQQGPPAPPPPPPAPQGY
ncbi:hypothetical protein NQ176_g11292 [Zarea fungicola]|uniref:Uncharacterized protein n=1 Tax=Zarea fungicola TaxID=93591 RepID=A0ACC1MBI7_9HYPO|nr:hypothetical protein NQ176_g11292 [Lecanicillium fungicola]